MENRQGDINFFWRGEIGGEADGTVRFEMRGKAHSTFRRNRIGFCILHPMRECVGQRCCVEREDGTIQEGAFPKYISPEDPFLDMRERAPRSSTKVPPLGLGCASHGNALSPKELDRLAAMHLSHLRVDLLPYAFIRIDSQA